MAMNQQAAYEFLIELKKGLSEAHVFSEKDLPEGMGYIKMTETCVNNLIEQIDDILEPNKAMDDIENVREVLTKGPHE